MHKKKPFSYSAKDSAMYFLSRRDHGTFELTRKLRLKGYEVEDIDFAIQYCSDNNYLDDLRYAKSQVRQHIAKKQGTNRIKQALKQNRVSDEVIIVALEHEKVDWYDLAKQAFKKKFNSKVAEDKKEYAKQVRFLQYRGFDFDQIHYALTSGE